MKGSPDWKLALCLFGAWTVAYLVIVKGIKSSGKASYFLALFPYVIIAILLVHACTLQGAGKGIIYFIKPQVRKKQTIGPKNMGYRFSNVFNFVSSFQWEHLLNPMVRKTLEKNEINESVNVYGSHARNF